MLTSEMTLKGKQGSWASVHSRVFLRSQAEQCLLPGGLRGTLLTGVIRHCLAGVNTGTQMTGLPPRQGSCHTESVLAVSCGFTSPPRDLGASGAELVSFVSSVRLSKCWTYPPASPHVLWEQETALKVPSSVLFLLWKRSLLNVPE